MPTMAKMDATIENALMSVVKKVFAATDSLRICCIVFTSSIATEGSMERSSDLIVGIRVLGSALVLTNRCLEKAVDWEIGRYTSATSGPLNESDRIFGTT